MSLGCKNTTGLPWAPILGSADSSRAWLDTAFMLDCTGWGRHALNDLEIIMEEPIGPIAAAESALRSMRSQGSSCYAGRSATHTRLPGLDAAHLPPHPQSLSHLDVIHLQAEVVHPALRVLLQKLGDGGGVPEGLQQLQLGIVQLDKHHGHAVLGDGLGLAHLHAQDGGVLLGRGPHVRHRNGDVVKPRHSRARLHPQAHSRVL